MTIQQKCPFCFKDISSEVWKNQAAIQCFSVENGHGKKYNQHASDPNWKPSSETILGQDTIPNDYRQSLSHTSKGARVLTLAGASRSGKSCYLLAFAGLTQYPNPTNPLISKLFPEVYEVVIRIAKAKSPATDPVGTAVEDVFLRGKLPRRTPVLRKALAYPIMFTRTRKFWCKRSLQSSILILNDIAGEGFRMEDPVRFANAPSSVHLSYSDDILFFIDTQQLDQSAIEFDAFLRVIQSAMNHQGTSLDLKKVNLHLMFSKIDLAQTHPSFAPIYQAGITAPYHLPQNSAQEELDQYQENMVQVHAKMQAFLKKEAPQLVRSANQTFGKVFYYPHSALGFAPVEYTDSLNYEGELPLQPESVRIADPILRILKDDGFF